MAREWEVRCVCPALKMSHDMGLECAPGAHLRFQGLEWARKCSGMISLLGTSGIHPCREQRLPFLALLFAVPRHASRLTLKRGESLSVKVLPYQAGKMVTGKEGLFSRVRGGKRIWGAEVRAEPVPSQIPALWWIWVMKVICLFTAVLSHRNLVQLTSTILHFLRATLKHRNKKKQAEFMWITYFI